MKLFNESFFTNQYLPIRKKKIFSVLSDSAVNYYK